jgi:type IV secretion system protein VirB1
MDLAVQMQIEQCAPAMNRALMSAMVRRESNFNRFAIGMDGKDAPVPQPRTLDEAVNTADGLLKMGKTFSVGLAQIHISNIKAMGIPWAMAFDGCTSLRNGQKIFEHFYAKAISAGFRGDGAVFSALRGYNSGSIYAAVSNKYASAIMVDAAKAAVPPLHDGLVAVRASISTSEPDNKSESMELFSK